LSEEINKFLKLFISKDTEIITLIPEFKSWKIKINSTKDE